MAFFYFSQIMSNFKKFRISGEPGLVLSLFSGQDRFHFHPLPAELSFVSLSLVTSTTINHINYCDY